MHQMQLGMSWRGGGGICKKSGNAAANHGLYGVPEPAVGKETKMGKYVSCACFTVTGKGPRAAEFQDILKKAHDK